MPVNEGIWLNDVSILMVVLRPGHRMEILSEPESGKGLFKPNGQGLQEISNPFSRSRV